MARFGSPALNTGVVIEDLQPDGSVPNDRDKLNRDGWKWRIQPLSAFGLEMPSGPQAVLVFIDVMRLVSSSLVQKMEDKWGIDDIRLV